MEVFRRGSDSATPGSLVLRAPERQPPLLACSSMHLHLEVRPCLDGARARLPEPRDDRHGEHVPVMFGTPGCVADFPAASG